MEFFNELGKRFTQAARKPAGRNREDADRERLSMDLREAEADLDRALCRLGRACYDSAVFKAGDVDPELIARVREAQDLVDALRAQRERAAQQIRCPGCGAMQDQNAHYCSNCGRPMPEKGPEADGEEPDPDREYCPECGAMRQEDLKYCAICGHAFSKEDESAETQPEIKRMFDFEPLEEPEYEDGYTE